MSRTALVLGAGIGGLVAAETLRKLLPPSDRVIAVDRAADHFFRPSLLWLMVGQREPADFTRPLGRLAQRGMDLRCGNVTRIDPGRCVAEIDGEAICADALVIALGADYVPEAIPGLAAAGLNLYAMDGATAIRDALARFEGGRVVIMTAAPAYKCPAAPYEAAMLVDACLRKRGVRDKTSMLFFAAEPQPMVVTGPEIGAAVRGLIEARGIIYRPEHQVKQVDPLTRHISFTNGAAAQFDLLIYVPPHRAPAVARDAGLTNESGWIPVDRHTLQTSFDNVFAIGDIISVPLKNFHPGLSVYGASVSGRAGEGVLSVEAAYYDSREDRAGSDAAVPNSQARLLVGYQLQPLEDLSLGLQYYGEYMRHYAAYRAALPAGFPVDKRWSHTITARLTQFFLHQTLRLSVYASYNAANGDRFLNPELRYSFTDKVWGAVGANVFAGKPWGQFGQLARDDNVYLQLRYEF